MAQMFTHEMNHNGLELPTVNPMKRRRSHFVRPVVLAAACCAALAFALVGPGFSRSANAQAMGEYGAMTAHSAGASSSMPKVGAPDLAGHTNAVPDNRPHARRSKDTQTYDSPSNDRSANDNDTDKDDSPHGNWDQVK
jgi:hypothetical protein